jgi:transcription elongation factor GreA
MYAAPGPQPGVNFFLCLEVRLLMIEALKQKLGEEVEKLQFELNVTLPGEIRRAVEMGDLRENSEYKAALERQQFVRARLSQLRERLSKLSSIDVTQIARDAVGLGSTVHVADEKTGLEETYQLVFGDAIEYEDGQVTMSSPIGRALLGKKVGEVTFLRLPTVTRQLKVKELKTIHDLTPGDVTEG